MSTNVVSLCKYRAGQGKQTEAMMVLVSEAFTKLDIDKKERHQYLFVDDAVYYRWCSQHSVMTHNQIDTCIFYTRLVRALTKIFQNHKPVEDAVMSWIWCENRDPPCNGRIPSEAILDGGREFLEELVTTLENRHARKESPTA